MPVAEGTCLMKLEAWIQKAGNGHRADFGEEDSEPSDPPEENFAITFGPRGRNSSMRPGAQCKFKVKHTDDSSGEEPWDVQITVELAFSSIVLMRQLERVDCVGNISSSSSGTPNSSPRMSLGGRLSGRPTIYGARASL